jgi:transposase-like protein
MHVKLQANATTTPRIRAYIQHSTAATATLARELGISARTVARWRGRREVHDRSHVPHRLATTMTDWEEALCVELRRALALPLDDIVEAMRRCRNPALSRSAIHRCLKRHGLSARQRPEKAPSWPSKPTARPASSISTSNTCRRSAASEATPMSRSTAPPASSTSRCCPIAAAKPPPASSNAFLPALPCRSDKRAKPKDKPTGDHLFDVV